MNGHTKGRRPAYTPDTPDTPGSPAGPAVDPGRAASPQQATRRQALQAGALVLGAPALALGSSAAQAQAPAPAAPGPAAAPPALEAFFQDPSLSAAALSPDGLAVALRIGGKGTEEAAVLAVLEFRTLQPVVVAAFKDVPVGRFWWVNDRRLVFELQPPLTGPGQSDYGRGLFAVDRDGTSMRRLVQTRYAGLEQVTGQPLHPNTAFLRVADLAGGDDIYVVRPLEISAEKVDYYELQRLNTRTGRVTDVDTPVHTNGWLFDERGRLRAVSTTKDGVVTVLLAEGSGWKPVGSFDPLDGGGFALQHIAPDGTVYAEAPAGDKTALFTFDPATGKLSDKPVLTAQGFDLHVQFVSDRKRLLGLRYTVDAEVTQWLDPALEGLQATIDGALKSTVNRLSVPQHGDSPWVLVQAWSDRQPAMTLAWNRETRRFTRLGATHPRVEPRQMGATQFVRIPARDGLEIPAYLTLPPGVEAKNLPLVVLAHGGPWVRGAAWGWNPEVQFLASRGYAVLQPEFRGSLGFGARHFRAGWKQWGAAMQDDLADAAQWAVARGVADGKRVALAGASYGGYAAVMGLVRHPQVFRCAVSWVGVTDPQLLFDVHWSDTTAEAKKYGMRRLIGDPATEAALLREASTLTHAARIRQPLMLAYGAWDVRVPIVHGQKLRDALRPHNPQLQWVVYDNEGHGWARLETRLDFWGRVEKFLAQHLAAG